MNVKSMSNEREGLVPPRPVVSALWRASAHRLSGGLEGAYIEAASGATWARGEPLASYRPAGKRSDNTGPHLAFLKLKGLLPRKKEQGAGVHEDAGFYDQALLVFAWSFGLLGLFHEEFSPPRPTLETKAWMAPEAVIDSNGRLQPVDPATEGTELLLDLLQRRGYFGRPRGREVARSHGVALPRELVCARKPRYGFWGPDLVPWEEARRDYGALLVLDEESADGVSVLCRREPYDYWRRELENFPYPEPYKSPGPDPNEPGDREREKAAHNRALKAYLNRCMGEGVTPYSPEDGEAFQQGHRCSTLLKALHLLLWLDKTGGGSIRKCQAPGCPGWFRAGSQPGSKYCPPPDSKEQSQCASRMSSRAYLERRKTDAT